MSFYDKNKSFNRFFRTRHAPDDYYVATVLFNSEYRERIDNKTHFFWTVFLPNNGGTKILDEADIDSIKRSGAIFVRKMDSKKSNALYSLIENLL